MRFATVALGQIDEATDCLGLRDRDGLPASTASSASARYCLVAAGLCAP